MNLRGFAVFDETAVSTAVSMASPTPPGSGASTPS
jgi:hypothetical protein